MTGRGKLPAFRKLCAEEQLGLLREYPRLIPRLMAKGLPLEDARAVAYNATLLYLAVEADPPLKNPSEALSRYSLGEIAELCGAYERVEAGVLEYGYAHAGENEEGGVD